MSIKFVCSCGKHLRAREGMAGRRSFCPKCGQPVGIPTNQPTHGGTQAAPMAPLDRLRARRVVPPPVATPPYRPPRPQADRPQIPGLQVAPPHPPQPPPVPVEDQPMDPLLVRLRNSRQTKHKRLRMREPWQMESHWYQCLAYPFRAWPLVLSFSILLTLLTGGAVLVLRAVSDMENTPWWFLALSPPCVLIPAVAVGYVCGFLDCIVTSAVVGEAQEIRWPGRQLRLAFKSCGNWLVCFLAGPVVTAVTAFFFWLHCGDPALADWLVLVELGCVTLGLWLLNLLAVSQRERLRDLHPARVVELVRRLGWPVILVVLGAALVGLALGFGLVLSLANLQSEVWLGLAGLTGSWIAILFCASFFFRWLGVWCYHRRPTPGN